MHMQSQSWELRSDHEVDHGVDFGTNLNQARQQMKGKGNANANATGDKSMARTMCMIDKGVCSVCAA